LPAANPPRRPLRQTSLASSLNNSDVLKQRTSAKHGWPDRYVDYPDSGA